MEEKYEICNRQCDVCLWVRFIKNSGKKMKTSIEETIGRLGHRFEDNVKIDLKGIGWKGVDWVHMDQSRQALVMSLNFIQSRE